jgi:hypothetical protein
MHFAIFPSHLSKILCLQRKCEGRSCEMLCLSRKIILANLKIWCSARCIFADPLQTSHACHRFCNCYKPSRSACFGQGAESIAPVTQNDSWTETHFAPQRSVLFNSSTSKSAPRMVCFAHFDFETCFATQRRALLEHLNFQKCFGNEILAFWLPNLLAPQRRAIFDLSPAQMAPHPPP